MVRVHRGPPASVGLGSAGSTFTSFTPKRILPPYSQLRTYLGGEINASMRVDPMHSRLHPLSCRVGRLRLD